MMVMIMMMAIMVMTTTTMVLCAAKAFTHGTLRIMARHEGTRTRTNTIPYGTEASAAG